VAHLRGEAVQIISIGKDLPVLGVDTITSATSKVREIGCIGVTMITLKCSKKPEAAQKFAEFIASDEAQEVFKKFGYTDIGGAVKMYENGEKIAVQTMPATTPAK
jgi:ABC-type glycerol-3-phosphate transport system substrate-binding protein